MQCPRCRNPITSVPDPGGFLICPGCGARLTAKAKTPTKDASNPNLTLPPGTPLKKIPRPGHDTAKSARPPEEGGRRGPEPEDAGLEAVLSEIRALRRDVSQVLRLLRDRAPGDDAPEELDDEDMAALLPPVRSRQRKSVLLIDDDPATREAALAELQAAEIPGQGCADGRAALEAIARDKPDVIALELELGGSVAGKDVINMIKATMEWVDIPIILYTRGTVDSQREARQIHGADDVVLKRSGPAALVSKVVQLFRRA
jgi:CheY-like chemotaxis protein